MTQKRTLPEGTPRAPLSDEVVRKLTIELYDEKYPNWRENSKTREHFTKLQTELLGQAVFSCDLTPNGQRYLPNIFISEGGEDLRFGVFVGWQFSSFDGALPFDINDWEKFTEKLLQACPNNIRDFGFQHLLHQAGGVNCSQVELIAKSVEISDSFKEIAKALCEKFYFLHYDKGKTLSDYSDFAKEQFERADVDVADLYDIHTKEGPNGPYPTFEIEEAYYPVPLTQENLRKITGTDWTINELITPFSDSDAIVSEARIFIIADNSD